MTSHELAHKLLALEDSVVMAWDGDSEQYEEVSCFTVWDKVIKLYTDDIS